MADAMERRRDRGRSRTRTPVKEFPSRPKCQCTCGCRKKPGRRILCPGSCNKLVGPGCCWHYWQERCHRCAYAWSPDPEPDPEPGGQGPIRCHTCGKVATTLPDNEYHCLYVCTNCETRKNSLGGCLAQLNDNTLPTQVVTTMAGDARKSTLMQGSTAKHGITKRFYKATSASSSALE